MNLIDALTAAKSAYELAAVAIQARDNVQTQSAMADLREKIWDMSNTELTQMQALHSLELETQKLRMKLADAERALEDLVRQTADEAKYQLAEIPVGKWVQVRIEDVEKPVERRPNFCSSCNSAGRKTPLQYQEATRGELSRLYCPVDSKHSIYFGERLPHPPAQAPYY